MPEELLDDLAYTINVSTDYAPIRKRVIAFFIDLTFVAFIHGFVSIQLFDLKDGDWEWWVFYTLFFVFYFAYCEASNQQATLGKYFLKIKVCTIYGKKLDVGQAVIRQFAKTVTYGLNIISLFIMNSTPKKQGIHDIMVKTIVVNDFKEHN